MSTTATTSDNPATGLNKIQKLAALLIVLGPEEASAVLSAFTQRQVEQIMVEMSKIEFLSAEVQKSLLQEFSSITLNAVTSAVGGIEKAQHVLEKSLGPVKAREVLGRVVPSSSSSPLLEELKNTPVPVLMQMLRGENAQTWALILVQLDPQHSVEIFRTMNADFRSEVMRRVARMEPISPEVLERLIKGLFTRRTEVKSREQVGSDGTQYLTDIMKRFDWQVANATLETLALQDPDLSSSIRKRMFAFDDLIKLDSQTMGIVLREVDFNTLAVAMKNCSSALSDSIFKSITKRAAESLAESLRFLPNTRRKDIEIARDKVMQTVFDLEAKGEIILNRGEEELSALAA